MANVRGVVLGIECVVHWIPAFAGMTRWGGLVEESFRLRFGWDEGVVGIGRGLDIECALPFAEPSGRGSTVGAGGCVCITAPGRHRIA
jgi:hypothetical protein